MKTYQKRLLGILVSVFVIIAGLQIYFSFFLDQQLKNIVVDRFHQTTDHKYRLSIDDFDLQLFRRELYFSDVKVTDKDTLNTGLHLTLDRFSISAINLFQLLINNRLRIGQITLEKPVIRLIPTRNSTSQISSWQQKSNWLAQKILSVFNEVIIPQVHIRNLSMNIKNTSAPSLSFNHSDLSFQSITIDSTFLTSERIIPAEQMNATFHNLHYKTFNSLYDITATSLQWSSTQQTLAVDNLTVTPQFDKEAFADQFEHEIDRIDLQVPKIRWRKIDFKQLNSGHGLTAESIILSDPSMEVYRDKRPPAPTDNRPPLPHEMMRNIPFAVAIDSVAINGGNIRYSERHPKAEKAGYISFNDLSGAFTNLTNQEKAWQAGVKPTFKVQTQLMNEAALYANFTFSMTGPSYEQHITGRLAPMDLQPLNKALVPMAFVRIDQGRILGMDFDMTLGSNQSTGELLLRYEDLKISLLDKESNKETFGKEMKSLFANLLKVKSNNTGKNPRTGEVNVEHNSQKSVFNYWWKSLLSGLKSSIGL